MRLDLWCGTVFSRLEAFLPVMAEENKKLNEAVAAGQGAKHNIEVEEEENADDEDDAMTGGDGQKEKNGKAPVIQMDFALGTMDEGDGDSDSDSGVKATAADPEAQIKAAIAAKESSALSGSKREEGKEASPFQMRIEKSSSKPRPEDLTSWKESDKVSEMQAVFIRSECGKPYTNVTLRFALTGTGPDLGGDVPGSPKTTSPEWQAASVEYAKAQKANPIRHFKG
ncbi:hypothetical protein BBJ28_00003965 [Nothophytophthora sp. Chile5]|nr:hypothetical protein BBJ28_00003965 [Nothophytophthora sp. Chile5]